MTNIRRSVLKRVAKAQKLLWNGSHLSIAVLRAFGYESAKAGVFYDHAAQTLPSVFPASYSEVAKPKRLHEDRLVLREPLPAIQPVLLKNTLFSPGCAMLRTETSALFWPKELERRHRFKRENGRSFVLEANGVCYFNTAKQISIKKGLCAIAPGAANWYHWLIEVLPTIMLMQNLPKAYDDYPLLVPEEVLSGDTFKDTLDLYIGTRPVIGLASDAQYCVGKMVIIPPPVSGPFNMHDHLWPVPEDYLSNIGVMQQFRTQTLDCLGVTYDGNGPKRVFLARPPGTRSYNQDDILKVAHAKGFEIVRAEHLSFREQVQMMHNADFVAAPSGAACANMVFMRPDTKSLIWALKEYDSACFFSNLGHVAGCQTTYCFVEADTPVKSTYEAFSASYVLSPKVFSDHLDALL